MKLTVTQIPWGRVLLQCRTTLYSQCPEGAVEGSKGALTANLTLRPSNRLIQTSIPSLMTLHYYTCPAVQDPKVSHLI